MDKGEYPPFGTDIGRPGQVDELCLYPLAHQSPETAHQETFPASGTFATHA